MRVQRLVAVLLGSALAVVPAGCGTEQSAGTSAESSPKASDPKASPAIGQLVDNPSPARQGATAALDPLARLRGIATASAQGARLALATGGLDGLTLQIAPASTRGGLDLRPAAGAGRVPWWARIHMGTDSAGLPVVSYPRCEGARLATCVPVVWSMRDEREMVLDGFERAGGVLEVAVDRGNAAVIATPSAQRTADDLAVGKSLRARAWVRRGTSRARVLPGPEPEHITLHGETLAVIRATNGGAGVCGEQDVALWRLDRQAAPPRVIDRSVCGLGGQFFSSVTLDRRRARIVMAANGMDAHALLRIYDSQTGRLTRSSLIGDPADVVWLDGTHGLAFNTGGGPTCNAGIEPAAGDDGLRWCTIARITLRSDNKRADRR